MKTFQIKNGDLVIGPGGYVAISGPVKLRQDLAIAMLEPLGSDRFHPRWGSLLSQYIGTPLDQAAVFAVSAEVRRIVTNHMVRQDQQITRDRVEGKKSRLTADEVVAKLVDVNTQTTLDRLFVRVAVLTLAGTTIMVRQTVEGF